MLNTFRNFFLLRSLGSIVYWTKIVAAWSRYGGNAKRDKCGTCDANPKNDGAACKKLNSTKPTDCADLLI